MISIYRLLRAINLKREKRCIGKNRHRNGTLRNHLAKNHLTLVAAKRNLALGLRKRRQTSDAERKVEILTSIMTSQVLGSFEGVQFRRVKSVFTSWSSLWSTSCDANGSDELPSVDGILWSCRRHS